MTRSKPEKVAPLTTLAAPLRGCEEADVVSLVPTEGASGAQPPIAPQLPAWRDERNQPYSELWPVPVVEIDG